MLAGLLAVDIGSPATMIPIGTVTGMLVAVFVLFLRDSARNDQRADVTAAKLVAAAEAERDKARVESERVHQELNTQLNRQIQQITDQCERDARERETRWNQEKTELQERIKHLEMMLYGKPPTI